MAAAGVSTDTPNQLMVVFSNTVTAGFDAISGAVSGVFGLMIVLVVALTGIQWALSANREVLATGFGKVLLIGVFAWLINDWQSLSETIYDGFIAIGLTAGGSAIDRSEFLNPGRIVEQGWLIVRAIGETPAAVNNPMDIVGNLMDAVILAIAMLGIMIAFAVLALQIIVALLEFKIVTLGGFILLPFGIWSKSAFLAERPLGYVVSSGLKVLALAIVVSGARTVFDQLVPTENPDIYEALTILVAALLLAMLAISIPNLAAALVTGGPALGAGAALGGALAVGGAAALAGGALVRTGAAVFGAGRNSAGASRISSSSRSAAGAGSGRSPSPPAAPTAPPPSGGAPRGPSNDNGPSASASVGSAGTRPPPHTGAGSRPSGSDVAAARDPAKAKAGESASDTSKTPSPMVEEANPQRRREARAAGRRSGAGGGATLFDAPGGVSPEGGAPSAAVSSEALPATTPPPQAPPASARPGPLAVPAAGPPTRPEQGAAASPANGPGTNRETALAKGSLPSPHPSAGSRHARDEAERQRASAARRNRSSPAMQAFFTANAARSLMPSDSVGALTPDLKREDR